MINLYEKGRIPSQEKEILTKSFLIDKIANDMKTKYKKVLSFINYYISQIDKPRKEWYLMNWYRISINNSS